jgi:hypothetical protein
MGRGLIQITGRANALEIEREFRVLVTEDPTLLEKFPLALMSAAYFWKTRNLNILADRGDTVGITRRVNGGLNHLAERIAAKSLVEKILNQPEIEESVLTPPTPVKKITQSTEAKSAIGVGTVGAVSAAANAVSEVNKVITETTDVTHKLLAAGWIVAVIVIVFFAYYLYRKRVERLSSEGN